MTEATLDHDLVEATLNRSQSDMDAAEVHGAICGLICASGANTVAGWQDQILGEDQEAGNLLNQEAKNLLQTLYNQTLEQFEGGEFGLRLLLSDDNAPLAQRIREMSDWCNGFLLGLGLAGIKEADKLPSEAGEVIRDFSEIARVSYDEEEDEEANENAYMEVTEYLRVGAMLVYDELNPRDENAKTLH